MIKIGLCGSPCTGKTTIAQNFSSKLRFITKSKVELIDEYARIFVKKFGKANLYDQYLIAHHQIDKEEQIKDVDYLVTDSAGFSGLIYSYKSVNWNNPKDVFFIQEIYSILINNFHSYDYLFFCPYLPIHNNVANDGFRVHLQPEELKKINKNFVSFLDLHNIIFFTLKGSLDEKIDSMIEIILGNNNANYNQKQKN
ncbi:MAG: AAA family ATPase [Bacillota bacterium]